MIETESNSSALVRKLWHYCNVLRDDGLSYPDYVEQLTYLLFLKMSDEGDIAAVPKRHGWRTLVGLEAREMSARYAEILQALSNQDGMLGMIFRGARNKIRDPAKLRMLIVDLIGQTEWTGLSADVKGAAYEGLLEKNARDTKSGAGQYFTPRPLIEAVVTCIDPKPEESVWDPACGTGGFLLAAHEHMERSATRRVKGSRRYELYGVELVEEVARLAAMNMLLHGIASSNARRPTISCTDSLRTPLDRRFDVVLTNPPFGVRGSINTSRNAASDEGTPERQDYWVETQNKQLNFIQLAVSALAPGGRAGIVVPDNVLFESGAAAKVRRGLIEKCRLHTILRLPAGLFYAHGVKANVLFFDKRSSTRGPDETLWVYDFRRGNRFSLKTKPLARADLDEFVAGYRAAKNSNGANWRNGPKSRWHSVAVKDVVSDPACNLDITPCASRDLAQQDAMARVAEIGKLVAADLQFALEQITLVASSPPIKQVDSSLEREQS